MGSKFVMVVCAVAVLLASATAALRASAAASDWDLRAAINALEETVMHPEAAAEGKKYLSYGGLTVHHYEKYNTCSYAEVFVKHQVTLAWAKDRSVVAALLRLVYADCMVTGCDASVLLDGKDTEKTAAGNYGLRGFDVIDRIKTVLEIRCPGVVSCADIINLAARDAVALAGAPKYPVFTGRKDGSVSVASAVDLPGADISWDQALQYFKSKGLGELELGTLLGSHSLGKTHCRFIYSRLYDFNGTGQYDTSMKYELVKQLRKSCPRSGGNDSTVWLNPESGASYNFTNSYYTRVLNNLNVLGIDQQFIFTRNGLRIADEFAAGFEDLRRSFALSMARMGGLKVLTGTKGEIRKNCHYTNAQYTKLQGKQ